MSPYATPIEVEAPSFASRLGAQMDSAGLTIRGLAEKSRVDKETISLWKRGKQTRVKVAAVAKVAAVLETTVADLLELPPTPEATLGTSRPHPAPPDHGDLLRRVAELENDVVPRLNRLAAEAREASD